jgi:hypothetical protein
MMYRDNYGRVWQGPYAFTAAAVSAIAPGLKGVYEVLYSGKQGKDVAYIGIATGDTIRGRLTKHVNERGNWALARLGDPSLFSFVYFECDALTARQIESHVVTTKKPPFNTRPELQNFIPSIAYH